MGKPMAKNLIKAGHTLVVFDHNQEPMQELVALGAKAAASLKEAVADTPFIITMLPNSPHVQSVALDAGGILENAKSGTIYVDMSSIAPLVAKDVGEKLATKGIIMLDAPVSGGEPKAIDGTLAIMVGGDEKAFASAKDILATMGGSVTHVGAIGSGNTTKLANQIIVALNIAAVSEAMTLATKVGVDPEKVFQAIRGGLAGSTVMDAKMPMILDGNFKPGFRIELHIKDLANALDTAHQVNAPIPLAAQVMEEMQALKADGKAAEDHSGLVQYYENLAKVKVRRK